MKKRKSILWLAISLVMLAANIISFLTCTHVMGMAVLVTIAFDIAVWVFMVMAFYGLAKMGGENE